MLLKFELSEQMTIVIANALGNHPYREAAPVIVEIQRQINNQMAGRQMNGGTEQPDVQHQPDNL